MKALRGLISRNAIVVLTAIALLGMQATASANVVLGTSEAFADSINLTLAGTPFTVGPLVPLSGMAPAPYALSAFSIATPATGNSAGSFVTGNLTTLVSSNVDGSAGTKNASATTVTDGEVDITGPGTTPPLLSIISTGLNAVATVSGDGSGPFTVTGTTLYNGLQILVNGNPIPGLVVPPAPNSTFSLVSGGVTFATLILNEQIISNTTAAASITLNAIDVKFTGANVPGYGVLTGSIILDHTFASLTAPEPSQFAMMGLVAVAIGLRRFSRRRGRPLPALESRV